jgi:bifunctional oligoribonuclease and PAP phosphatase NrnA
MSLPSQIADFLREHDDYLIVTHVFPDGDNMGSMLALAEALDKLGKKVARHIEGAVPLVYAWMPGAEKIDSDIDRAVDKLHCTGPCPALLVVDSSDLHRAGDSFIKWFESQKNLPIVNVDHHVTNSGFGTINWVDPSYSSTGEMIYEIIRELDLTLTQPMAQNLFVSVYTDTGRFSFSNTTERSLRYASEYVAAGALPITAFRNVYANRSLASFHLQAKSFQTMQKFLDDRGCYFWVDREMFRDTGTTMEDTEGFIDAVRTLRDFEIVVFFKEIETEDIRVSIRAHPPINASALMGLFGGGGHPRAAGARIDMPLPAAIHHFISEAERAIKSGEVLETRK